MSRVEAFREVFSRSSFVLLATFVSAATFLSIMMFSHFRLLGDMATEVERWEFLRFAAELFKGTLLASTAASLVFTVLISALFGIYFSMLVFLLRMRTKVSVRNGAFAGVFATFSGVLGAGCAACGSVFAGLFFSAIGASATIILFPFGGNEFAVVGVLGLVYAISAIAHSISTQTFTCPVR